MIIQDRSKEVPTVTGDGRERKKVCVRARALNDAQAESLQVLTDSW